MIQENQLLVLSVQESRVRNILLDECCNVNEQFLVHGLQIYHNGSKLHAAFIQDRS
jgi:hypothetical protein